MKCLGNMKVQWKSNFFISSFVGGEALEYKWDSRDDLREVADGCNVQYNAGSQNQIPQVVKLFHPITGGKAFSSQTSIWNPAWSILEPLCVVCWGKSFSSSHRAFLRFSFQPYVPKKFRVLKLKHHEYLEIDTNLIYDYNRLRMQHSSTLRLL